MSNEFTTVPIIQDFDSTKVVGELKILTSALPRTKGFVFTLGTRSKDELEDTYELVCVSPIEDMSYLAYLQQQYELTITRPEFND